MGNSINLWRAALNFGINALLPAPTREAQRELAMPEIGDLNCVQRIKRKPGSVSVILGRRESGKTVAAYRLAEIYDRPIYAISPEQVPPSGITELTLEQLADEPPPHSTLIVDDAPVVAGNHDYNNPFVRALEKLIPVVRHRRMLHLIFNSQLAALVDKYTLDADIVLLKPPSLLYADLERPTVKKLQDVASKYFEGQTDDFVHKHIFVYSHTEKGLARVQKRSGYDS